MQAARFHDGSFVVHRIRFDGIASRFSIWARADGALQDAERIDSRGRAYFVARDSALWSRLACKAEYLAPRVAQQVSPSLRCHAPAEYGGSPI